jgi:STE24 endopeptidase
MMGKIHPLLDQEKQRLARRYEKEKRLWGLAEMLVSLIVLLSFYYSGLSRWMADTASSHSAVWASVIYIGALYSILALLGFPLNFYSTYVHEHQWNFSNQTFPAWLWGRAKSFFVGLVISGLALGLLLWIMARTPGLWWLVAGAAAAALGLLFSIVLPVIILPIFHKYTPIQDRVLTEALRKILSRGGLKSSGFFKEDMSRQTKKENAFLAGLGKTRRVILADNLMAHMTVPEVESVIAHEVGHYKHRHIWKSISLGTLRQTIVFYLLNAAMRSIFPSFLSSTRSNLTLLPWLAVLAGAISGVLFGLLGKAISRFFEGQADEYALASISDRGAFMTALAGLANRNLSNAYPAWWEKWLYSTHPPIGERLDRAEKWQTPE